MLLKKLNSIESSSFHWYFLLVKCRFLSWPLWKGTGAGKVEHTAGVSGQVGRKASRVNFVFLHVLVWQKRIHLRLAIVAWQPCHTSCVHEGGCFLGMPFTTLKLCFCQILTQAFEVQWGDCRLGKFSLLKVNKQNCSDFFNLCLKALHTKLQWAGGGD